MHDIIYIFVIIFCIGLEAFFSGSEIAAISMDKIRLKHMLRKKAKGAELLSRMIKKPEWLLGTTLVGTNLAVVLSNTVATYLIIKWLGSRYEYLTILIMSPVLLIFGEILPKTIFQQRSGQIAPRIIYPLKVAAVIFSPVVFLTSRVSNFISFLFGKDEKERDPYVTKDELELLLKMSDAKLGGMKNIQKKMIHRIFDFKETQVREVMIPIAAIKSVELDEPLEGVIEKMATWKHSRIPVHKERFDNIVGVISSFDFIIPPKRKSLKSFIRPVPYFPIYASIDSIMVKMQHDGQGMAAVVDEYGSVIGIVTLEDIIEEVVGEIDDEFDHSVPFFRKISEREFIVDGKIGIDALRDDLGVRLPQGDYTTLSGFIMDRMKKIPKKGEICNYKKIIFEVARSSSRSIEEVRLLLED
jgi:putative hemolysin